MSIARSQVMMSLFIVLFICGCNSSQEGVGNTAITAGDTVASQDTAGTSRVGVREELRANETGGEINMDMTQFPNAELDLNYAGNTNPRQTLDIVYPRNGAAPYKFIVVFHGGRWMSGNKRSEKLASIFQATTQGYAVVTVNYRLPEEVKWPGQLHDAKAAIRFVRSHSGKYRLDAEKIVVWGLSAGGHLAEMLGATNDKASFEDISMGNRTASSAVQGIVSWCGVSDITALTDSGTVRANELMGFDVRADKAKARNASPVTLVTGKHLPLLLVHGTNDQFVPYQQSADMMNKVNTVTGNPLAELITVDGAAHEDPEIMTKENAARCLDFVDKILYEGNNPYRNTNYRIIQLEEPGQKQ